MLHPLLFIYNWKYVRLCCNRFWNGQSSAQQCLLGRPRRRKRPTEQVESFYALIRPEPNYYCYWNSRIHELRQSDTENAPVFSKVWTEIAPLIEGLPLVAHNCRFDQGYLKAVFQVYQMDYPDYTFLDTLTAARHALPHLDNHQLHTVAAACGYQLEQHHHALADAEACAAIAKLLL